MLPDGSLTVKEKYDLDFAVLSDVGNAVATPLGIVWVPGEAARGAQVAIGLDLPAVNGIDDPELPMPNLTACGNT